MQHAAADTVLGRKLRDQTGWKIEIEILDFHRAYYTRRLGGYGVNGITRFARAGYPGLRFR
jgi:hypothetical protein